jgi:hypothetical protein
MITNEELDKVIASSVPTEETLESFLRYCYRPIVVEADDWRPLAKHVRAMILACIKGDREERG